MCVGGIVDVCLRVDGSMGRTRGEQEVALEEGAAFREGVQLQEAQDLDIVA